jgi:hypothetical protein
VLATKDSQSPPEIRLKVAAIKDMAAVNGWGTDREIAEGLGTSAANLCRLLKTDKPQAPGTTFIATVLRRFPDKAFEDFFEVVPEPAEEAA